MLVDFIFPLRFDVVLEKSQSVDAKLGTRAISFPPYVYLLRLVVVENFGNITVRKGLPNASKGWDIVEKRNLLHVGAIVSLICSSSSLTLYYHIELFPETPFSADCEILG